MNSTKQNITGNRLQGWFPVFVSLLLTVVSGLMVWAAIHSPLYPSKDPIYIFPDEFYQALCCRDYMQAPLGMFTFWLGHIATMLFGDSLLTLRYLCWFMVMLSIVIGIAWMWHRTHRLLLCAVTLFCATAAATLFSCDNYDWYTATYPLLTACALLTLSYWHKPRTWLIAAIAAITAIMVAARMPLAAVLPFMLVVIITANTRAPRRIFIDSALGLAVFALTFLLLIIIMCGSPAKYLAAFTPENIISGHTNPVAILRGYVRKLYVMLSMGIWAGCTLPAAAFINRLKVNCTWRWLIMLAVACIFAGFSVKAFRLAQEIYGTIFYCPGLLFGIYAGLLLLKPVNNMLKGRTPTKPNWKAIIICIVFPLLLTVGSDTPIVRIFLCSLLPVVIGLNFNRFPRLISATLLMLAVVLSGMYAVERIYNMRATLTSDATYADIPRIGAIWVDPTEPHHDEFVKLAEICASLQAAGYHVLVCGEHKYIADYLFTDSTGYALNQFHSRPDMAPTITASLRQVLTPHTAVIYLPAATDHNDPLPQILAMLDFTPAQRLPHNGTLFLTAENAVP